MPGSQSLLVSLATIAGVAAGLQVWSRRKGSLPTSPKWYPIIGNLLSMPQNNEHIGFIELGKQLNADMFSLEIFGTVIIVLNSFDDAINLLEKRGGIYSDRAVPPMISEPSLFYWPEFIGALRYNDRWKKTRRLIHPWLHKKASESFHDSQQEQARLLLQRLSRSRGKIDSEWLYGEFFFALAGTLMHSIYGYKLESMQDPFVTEAHKAVDRISQAAMPTNFLVNLFPSLVYVPEWFPGAGWKRTARQWREQQRRVIRESFDWTKTRIASGNHESCIIASLLTHAEQLGLEADEVDDYTSQIAMTLFGVYMQTANVFLVFVLEMIFYPEAQAKAQEEIDRVIPRSRLPVMEDREHLPYINRLIKEVLRWRPVVPTGIPHACFQDDIYQGFAIPKGAMVIGNIWAMSRDEKVYPDSENFNPDRFLDPSVPDCPVFGFGRRECPGLHFAEASVFIIIASLLSVFKFEVGQDENGQDCLPDLASRNSVIYHPKPFKLRMALRSVYHDELVSAII
ncbi:O-methylsterigmatocystin oxidoreductase [Rhizoctonia solani AG-3 Rhs1AP]|uniref:O-methylsterigmatocystin oxidoreductase n=1 Tax=Rhizoctonia solani AG-3 Rhs1AP TaxID=1086054 RepID=X8JGJ2_9AGAM|nr:O-methylsterigmatocystin oxidoreductase [Rhizoctonia solani AG-3 Rhs1AP]